MYQVFEWKEDFVTGCKIVDEKHEKLFFHINELNNFLLDTKKYSDKIEEKIIIIKILMIEHLDIENNLLNKYKTDNYEEHLIQHENIKITVETIAKYNLPKTLTAILLMDALITYFIEHFEKYDKYFINQLKLANINF